MIVILLALLLASPAWSAEFAVVQSAAPTSNGGTQDLTSSGFGTPLCSLFWGGLGTVNGTVASNAGFWIGAYDGTRQFSIGGVSESGVSPMDTGSVSDTDSAMVSLLPSSSAQDGDGTASFITDGARLTWADAPPSAYLINALLIGGSGVSDCYVGQVTSNASQDGTTAVTAPGFTPDVVIMFSHNNNTTHMRPSIGFAWKNGGSIVQRGMGFNDSDGGATAVVSSILSTTRVMAPGLASASAMELTSFDANGFTVTTRDAGGARLGTYLAFKLNGISAYAGTSAAPTSTGDASITGVGFRPQMGLMLLGEWAAVDTLYTTDDGELFGLSAFTSSAAYTSSVYSEDSNGTSASESVTSNTVCRTRKDAANYATCSFVSFDGDGATLNYSVTNGSARQRAVLFVQTSTAPPAASRRVGPMVFP